MHVALFAVSSYCSTLQRTGKPFNPLLNETFEYSECSGRDGRGVRFLAEQVGPSSTIRVPLFAARSLNATGQCRVTLSRW